MFIKVTLPHGTTYLRADRIQSVMPIAEGDYTSKNGIRSEIIMMNDTEGWWVQEDAFTILERIYAVT